MSARYDLYRFNTGKDDVPLDSDVIYAIGLQIGGYRCPYATLKSTGDVTSSSSSPFVASLESGDGRTVTVSNLVGSDIYFRMVPAAADDSADCDMHEFLYPLPTEPGVYGSYKRTWRESADPPYSVHWRTSLFVPSSLGLGIDQAWAIAKLYLKDPTDVGRK